MGVPPCPPQPLIITPEATLKPIPKLCEIRPGTILNSLRYFCFQKGMSVDDIKSGQRINCNGVYGTVIGKRNTRNQRFVLVKMDNGFTLKLNAHMLSAGAAVQHQQNLPRKPTLPVPGEQSAELVEA
jgi:hypothetical protein